MGCTPEPVSSCQKHLATFQHVCEELGIPVVTEKIEWPSTSLTFLRIVFYTSRMEAMLPDDKLQCIQKELFSWLG